MEKEVLRHEILKRIKEYRKKEEASKKIVEELLKRDDYRNAERILAFFPLQTEPDITPLFSESRILFPYIENGEMKFSRGEKEKSTLGVYLSENKNETPYENALILVPLIAYDSKLMRLGRGGGYYDRYLRKHRNKLKAVGICFRTSFVSALPVDEWDEPLDDIITY